MAFLLRISIFLAVITFVVSAAVVVIVVIVVAVIQVRVRIAISISPLASIPSKATSKATVSFPLRQLLC